MFLYHSFEFLQMFKASFINQLFFRILWCLIIVAAFGYNHYSIKLHFEHYWANPTVVTIKKDFRNWENPFPAVTACYVNKVDPEKAKKYIQL